MKKTVDVKLANSYKITISQNCDEIGKILKEYILQNAILIYDCNFPVEFLEKIKKNFAENGIIFECLKIKKCGEDIKTLQTFEEICNKLTLIGVNRKTTLIAIGGGTIGDFVGFVASTFMRGLPFIQIPTTLLSMVDSSVGGKVAVNLGKYKNFIGSFYQPKHVFIDVSFLKALEKIELISGYAEVLKYGFIQDRNFYEYLLQNEEIFASFIANKHLSSEIVQYLIEIIVRSCQIKAQVVLQDEHETLGIRDILNFGHTFAHAFEGLYLGKIPHGIAVGIGMIYALKYSKISVEEILKHYNKIGLLFDIKQFCKINSQKIPSSEEILSFMLKDKKNERGSIKLILLEKIGKALVREEKTENIADFLLQVL